MATNCLLNAGLPLPCKNFMPGLLNVYVANQSNLISYSANSTNVVTGLTLSAASFYYKFSLLKESGELIINDIATPGMGTTAYEHVVNMYLAHFQTTVNNILQTLSVSQLSIIVQDRNSQYWLCGATNGMDMSGTNTGNTGKGYIGGDPNGWTLSFNGQETQPPLEVSASVLNGIISN